jgi:hypothetical protein
VRLKVGQFENLLGNAKLNCRGKTVYEYIYINGRMQTRYVMYFLRRLPVRGQRLVRRSVLRIYSWLYTAGYIELVIYSWLYTAGYILYLIALPDSLHEVSDIRDRMVSNIREEE